MEKKNCLFLQIHHCLLRSEIKNNGFYFSSFIIQSKKENKYVNVSLFYILFTYISIIINTLNFQRMNTIKLIFYYSFAFVLFPFL